MINTAFNYVLACYIASNRWSLAGHLPVSLATEGVALREGELVVAGGEDLPAQRSPVVVGGV